MAKSWCFPFAQQSEAIISTRRIIQVETGYNVINVFGLRLKINFWAGDNRYCKEQQQLHYIPCIIMGSTFNQSKYLHDNSAMVCSLMVLNELSNRIGVKHRWQAKLTLTLGLDISNCSDSRDFRT